MTFHTFNAKSAEITGDVLSELKGINDKMGNICTQLRSIQEKTLEHEKKIQHLATNQAEAAKNTAVTSNISNRFARVQVLQWACCNSTFGAFQYVGSGVMGSSSEVIRALMMSWISDRDFDCDYLSTNKIRYPTEEMKKDFQDKLTEQIISLTGIRPVYNRKGERCMIAPSI